MLKEILLEKIDHLLSLGYVGGGTCSMDAWDLPSLRETVRRLPYDQVDGAPVEEYARAKIAAKSESSVALSYYTDGRQSLLEVLVNSLSYKQVGLITGWEAECLDIDDKLLLRQSKQDVTPFPVTAGELVGAITAHDGIPQGTAVVHVRLYLPLQEKRRHVIGPFTSFVPPVIKTAPSDEATTNPFTMLGIGVQEE